jgi:hypothetical protein
MECSLIITYPNGEKYTVIMSVGSFILRHTPRLVVYARTPNTKRLHYIHAYGNANQRDNIDRRKSYEPEDIVVQAMDSTVAGTDEDDRPAS